MSRYIQYKRGTKLWVMVEDQVACGTVQEDYDSRFDHYVDLETGTSWRTIFMEREVFKTKEDILAHIQASV